MQKQKGFTIIELIVVIAIIAVLATIVMINVTSYIGKSKDAAIKGNMSSIASTAAGIYDTYSSYNYNNTTAVSVNATVANAVAQITTLAGNVAPTVQNIASAWCICSNLVANSNNVYCADSTGYRGEVNNATACSARCNATTAVCH